MLSRCFVITAWILSLVVSACTQSDSGDDPRCLDERIGAVLREPHFEPLPAPASQLEDAPVGGLCDGSSEIRLVIMAEANGPVSIQYYAYLTQFGGQFLVLDGKCHYYALDFTHPRLKDGVVSADTLAQLTADLKLDALSTLPSSKDNRTDHFSDTLIATKDHSLRCRDQKCTDSDEASAAVAQVYPWIHKLAEQGLPAMGELEALAFPMADLPYEPDEQPEPGPAWPLQPTLRSLRELVVTGIPYNERELRGRVFWDVDAAALRAVRGEALQMMMVSDFEPATVNVHDCGQIYRLLLRDEVPSRVYADLPRFLEAAWARPVITSCITSLFQPPVTPCPADL